MPLFHDYYLSGSDEFQMRWEYCAKMTFKKGNEAEWHSWATYRHEDWFKKLFMNYLKEHNHHSREDMDMKTRYIEIELAVYDERGWNEIQFDIYTNNLAQTFKEH